MARERGLRAVGAALAVVVVGLASARAGADVRATTYANPVYAPDFPDPFVLADGGAYWGYATNGADNVPVIRSDDLTTWAHVGDALPQLPAWAEDRDVWAPGVLRRGSTYVLYYAAVERSSGLHCISRAVGTRPQGPFVDRSGVPFTCQRDRRGSIDPSPFVDVDGRPWLLWKSEGHVFGEPTRLWSQRLTDDGLQLVGDPVELTRTDQAWEEPIIENPTMIRAAGAYHLLFSAGHWSSSSYAVGWARCTSPAGPCSKPRTGPVMSARGSVLGPGGQSFFAEPDGSVWLAYHAWTDPDVGYPRGSRSLRIDKVDFVGGAPVVDGPTTGPQSLIRSIRVAGVDRAATAAAVALREHGAGVDVAYVASGDHPADALTIGPVAAGSGPLLLVHRNGVPPATAAALRTLGPRRIEVLGGTSAVPEPVRAQLATFAPEGAIRIAGADRYGTAVAISRRSFPSGGPVVYVAAGDPLADALAAAPVAATRGAPVVLVPRGGPSREVADELARLAPDRVVVVGGTATIPDSTARLVAGAAGAPVERIAGADRIATAAALARTAFAVATGHVYVASGWSFTDAVVAGATGRPLLLVGGDVRHDTATEVLRLASSRVVVVGGPAAVPDRVVAALD